MPNDYEIPHQARKQNQSRIVVEGADEPAKGFASRVPEGYKSPDVEDRRDSLSSKLLGKVQSLYHPNKPM